MRLLGIYGRLRKRFGHRHWWPGETPFEVMVGAILTQNTAWTNVEKAIANLKAAGVLDAGKMLELPDAELAQHLRPSGYFNIKTQRLKSFLKFYREGYGADLKRIKKIPLPALREQLLAVHGIGPETADSILLYALGKRTFVVDAYTRRIFSRLGLVGKDATYDEMQKFFHANLPLKIGLYNDYHAQIVQLGKDICRPKPRCPICPVQAICRFSRNAAPA